MNTTVSRRGLVKGAALGAAALSVAGASAALAEEASSYTYADTIEWAAQYDVVVLGMGFAGMVSAMEAADAGATVLLCEKCPEGEAGGNSRVCGQLMAYSDDDPENVFTYYKSLYAGREIPEERLRVISNGAVGAMDMMSDKFGFNREEFVDWSDKLAVFCPEYPELPCSENVSIFTIHAGVSDSYLYQSTKARLVDNYADKIDVWFETPGTALIQDPESKAIIGVTVDRKGEARNVRAVNGVCVCTGGFEDDPKMVQDYLNVINYAPIGGLYNTGDGIRMCQEVGARLWHMAAYEGGFALCGCGYDTPEGANAVRMESAPFKNPTSMILVGNGGKRFGDEGFGVRHGHMPTGNGIWENLHYPEHIWGVWDQAKMGEIEEAAALDENYRDTIVACGTVAEAAQVIGCDEAVLQQTIADFNAAAEQGRDAEFGRDAEKMRAFDGEAYYVMPMKNLILNTQGGPERNENAEVLGLDGDPIPHLYSAGEMGGITALMYQGATNVLECFVAGQLAGANAATAKDELTTYEAAPRIESTPAGLGDETDLAVASVESGVSADGSLVGGAQGMGGNVPVTVTLDADGKIAAVEVGDNSETQGIGTKAIEQLPEKLVGLSTADEIDAVDAVSGATVTSKAIKAAVKEAMGL